MWLALAAVSILLFGLIVHARGHAIATTGRPAEALAAAGRRASSFGALIAVVAAPWLVIGFAASQFH